MKPLAGSMKNFLANRFRIKSCETCKVGRYKNVNAPFEVERRPTDTIYGDVQGQM